MNKKFVESYAYFYISTQNDGKQINFIFDLVGIDKNSSESCKWNMEIK